MQAQAQVGILGTIFGGLVECHLIETNLAGAFAAQGLEGNRLEAEVAPRQLSEVVTTHAVLA